MAWVHSEDEEHYYSIEYDTKAEAIAGGRSRYDGDFYVGESRRPSPMEFIDADDIEDMMCERAGELWDGVCEDVRDSFDDDAKKELNELLSVWATKHVKIDGFVVDGPTELVEAEND